MDLLRPVGLACLFTVSAAVAADGLSIGNDRVSARFDAATRQLLLSETPANQPFATADAFLPPGAQLRSATSRISVRSLADH